MKRTSTIALELLIFVAFADRKLAERAIAFLIAQRAPDTLLHHKHVHDRDRSS